MAPKDLLKFHSTASAGSIDRATVALEAPFTTTAIDKGALLIDLKAAIKANTQGDKNLGELLEAFYKVIDQYGLDRNSTGISWDGNFLEINGEDGLVPIAKYHYISGTQALIVVDEWDEDTLDYLLMGEIDRITASQSDAAMSTRMQSIQRAKKGFEELRGETYLDPTVRSAMRFSEADILIQATAWDEGIVMMPSQGVIVPAHLFTAPTILDPSNRSSKLFDGERYAKWLNQTLASSPVFKEKSPLKSPFGPEDISPVRRIQGEQSSGGSYRLLKKIVINERILEDDEYLRWVMVHESHHVNYPGLPIDSLNEAVTELVTQKNLGVAAAPASIYDDWLKILKHILAKDLTGQIEEALLESYRTGDISTLRQSVMKLTGSDQMFLMLTYLELFEFNGNPVNGYFYNPRVFDLLRLQRGVIKRLNQETLSNQKHNPSIVALASELEKKITWLLDRNYFYQNRDQMIPEDFFTLPQPVDLKALDIRMPFAETSKYDAAPEPQVTPGGIDLNAAHLNLQIKRDGQGVPLPFAQQDLRLFNTIKGFVPLILEIKPALNLPILSELRLSAQSGR